MSDYGKTYRNLLVVRAFVQGKKPSEIAAEFNISRQRVDQILDRANELLFTTKKVIKPFDKRAGLVCGFYSGRKDEPPCGERATKKIVAGGKTESYHYACDKHYVEMIERANRAGIPIVRVEDISEKGGE